MSAKTNNHWTHEEIAQLKALAASGHTAQEITEHIDRSDRSVREKAQQMHGVLLRGATPKATRTWLKRKLDNLQRRLGTLAKRVDRDDAEAATAVKGRLAEERSTLAALLDFARRQAIPRERYDRRVERIRLKLEAIRARIQTKPSIRWKDVLTVVNLVLVVALRLHELFVTLYETVGPLAPLLAA